MKMIFIFEKFKEINNLKEVQDKHKAWLKLHEGLKFGRGIDGHYKKGEEWTKSKYSDKKFTTDINLVGRLPNQTRIEFDGDENEAKKYLELTEEKLIKNNWAYIRSSHNGKCDYLWVEFNRSMNDKEIVAFFNWLAPEGGEIDLNFASSNKIFPCMFAVHWKHSYFREMPLYYKEGEQINFDNLNIKVSSGKKINEIKENGFKYQTFKKAANVFSDKILMAKEFCQKQPLYYDKSGMFWLWDYKEKYWQMYDETDILNILHLTLGADTINSKERNEILQSLKQVGRLNKPLDLPTMWIQFKNGIIDLNKPNELKEATAEYFTVNPLPYNISESDLTPCMDKIFTEWVGNEHIKTLYQILAYSLLPDYPIHRIFCFIGSGLNGKSKFLDLLRNFIGSKNVASTELDSLISSRFEVARLYKKLVCQMGETNFGELHKTSMLKKLSGGDLIGFEYKNKTPFEDKNYAKILISTNNLPATTDKTIGFYRRWLIIDFPNQFSEKKDILKDIPEEEYSALGRKCINILNELLTIREFHKEGTIEERMEKYESKSNFIEKFLKEFTIEDYNGYITKADFYKKFNSWSKENRHREMSETSVGMNLKKIGISEDRKYFDWLYDGKGGQARVWIGISWK